MKQKIKSCFIEQPHHFFMLTACFLFFASFTFLGQTTNLHLHDTYFVFPTMYVVWALAILFLAVWSLYCLTVNALLNNRLVWFHFFATIIALAAFIIAAPKSEIIVTPNFDLQEYERRQKIIATILSPFALLFLVGQAAYLVNLTGGIVRLLRRK